MIKCIEKHFAFYCKYCRYIFYIIKYIQDLRTQNAGSFAIARDRLLRVSAHLEHFLKTLKYYFVTIDVHTMHIVFLALILFDKILIFL